MGLVFHVRKGFLALLVLACCLGGALQNAGHAMTPVGYGFGPDVYESELQYGVGVYFAPYNLNIYAEPNTAADVVESLVWSEKTPTSNVRSTHQNLNLPAKNTFLSFYPNLQIAIMPVVSDTDDGWLEVVYDQDQKKTGWVPNRQQLLSSLPDFIEPGNEQQTPADLPPHMGVFQTWIDFVKLNAKANGIYWLNGVSDYHRNIRTSPKDTAKFVKITVMKDLKVRHARGNWLLVEVLDFNRNTPIGWVRWRDANGRLLVFPNLAGGKFPMTYMGKMGSR
ncbi:MAG: hypothetical protein KTR14_00190 [Vampirovibrio sp.]|nr:hypothetical protein [Vampirovibrio sp.]